MYKLILLVLFLLVVQSCVAPQRIQSSSEADNLQSELHYLLNDPNLSNAYVGIYIESLENGQILFKQNEHKIFVPASNMKLYTTATGLDLLGPEFKYETFVGTNGSVKDSLLDGDLIIKGSGDPTISGRFYDDEIMAVFQDWADSLKQAGIREINGNLIADNSFFEQDVLADGWNWDDEPFWYSAQPSALSFNDNCVDFIIGPGREIGRPLTILENPDIGYLQILNNARTGTVDSLAHLDITRLRAQNIAQITGSLPLDSKPVKESISVENPAAFFLQSLQEVLDERNIKLSGTPQVFHEPQLMRDTLFVHRSPQLSEIIRVINKKSHNFYAEQLLKTLGKKKGEQGSFKRGTEVVSGAVSNIGVAPNEFIMVDGSGLSRKNFVSPLASATLLKWMYHHSDFEYYYESLPIAGIDGTIKNRMKGTAAQGNVRAKTGYVRHMRALSGYVRDKKNRPYVFSIMVNNYTVPTAYVNAFQDKICILLSNLN